MNEPTAITTPDRDESQARLIPGHLRDFLRKSNSEATRRAYRATLTMFQDFLSARRKTILETTPADVMAFRDDLLKGPRPRKPASVALRLSVLRSFFGYLHLAGLVSINPADARLVAPPTLPEGISTMALTPRQVRMLLAGPDRKTVAGARDLVILTLMARLALRAAEVVSIKQKDILKVGTRTPGDQPFSWIVRVTVKGGRERRLPLPDDVKAAIDHYLRMDAETRKITRSNTPDSALIQRVGMGRTIGGTPLTTRALWNIVRKYGKYAGIDDLHPHTFRHTAITRALDLGLSYRDVQMMSGHRSIETVHRYDAHRDDISRNAINKLTYDDDQG